MWRILNITILYKEECMNNSIRKICNGLIIAGLLGTLLVHKTNAEENGLRKIIVFDESFQAKDNLIEKYGIRKIKDLPLINSASVHLTQKQEFQLKNEKGIIRIEDDLNVVALGKDISTTPPVSSIVAPPQIIPWGISRIKVPLLTGINSGTGIKLAVIDSGIELNHPDLKENIKGGYNAIDKKVSPTDDYGHGTHVAGIIAAQNNSIGVVGVSANVSLYSVKVLDSNGNGYLSDLIEGIEWSIKNGIQIINMSLGVTDSISLHDSITKANQAGIILVAAAGNNPYDVVKYPAAYQEVISVVATDSNDQIWYGCPKGKVDISAPGVDVYSTYKNGSYSNMSGTSIAAPHVAGAAALLLSNPLKSDLNGDGIISSIEIKQRLQDTAEDLGELGKDDTYGAGLLDIYDAITR